MLILMMTGVAVGHCGILASTFGPSDISCGFRLFLTVGGIIVTAGALFMRSYRIYLIFDNPVLLYGNSSNNRLQSKSLVAQVGIMVIVAYALCIGKE